MRRSFLKIAGLAAIVTAFGSTLALAQELPARVKTAGKIVIATNPNYAPISFKDPATNALSGFDVELGEAIGKELGLKVEWQEIAFAQMLPSLQTGRVDMALAWMADNPRRRETVDFVNYAVTGAQFYTTEAFKNDIKAAEDLCGKSVGASRSTTWPADIEKWSAENCVAKGKAAVTPVGTEGSVDARTQLKTQRLQAAVHGSEVMAHFMKMEPNTYIPLGRPFTRALVGIPFAKTEEGAQLREAVRGAMTRLQSKGIYAQLLAKYGLLNNSHSPVTVNQGT
jgi:polar amino acid transport system substrate-binding protein